MRQLLPGILFAALWASASTATKFGIRVGQPLMLANCRFIIAGVLMLAYGYLLRGKNNRFPNRKEWKQLSVFALLNTTIYLGAFVMAMREVSAGIGSLSTATNPIFIIILSALWLKRRLRWYEIAGLIFAMAGVALATFPLFEQSYATIRGLVILLTGMLSVSAATVYYASIKWKLSSIIINGWQVLLGGLFLLPFTLFTGNTSRGLSEPVFWGAVFWLVIPVSVIALQLWFFLVKQDPVRASLWLFLCPIFGFIYSWSLVGEPITWYTWAGTALVIAGLYLAQNRFRKTPAGQPQNKG